MRQKRYFVVLPRWGGGHPLPTSHPLGAFGASILGAYGASILAPSALGVPVLFHLQFEPCAGILN